MRSPGRLRRGDRIAVSAPAGPVDPTRLRAGAEVLSGWGLRVVEDPGLLSRKGYLAGPDERRRDELLQGLTDPQAAAVWFARGGYGTLRTLQAGIDLAALIAAPRTIVGFSDLTPLLNLVAFGADQIAVHGPTLVQLSDLDRTSREHLHDLLFDPRPGVVLQGREMLVPGRVEGRLCGGNLVLLAHSLATPFAVETRGRVLLIEEVDEAPYRLDRLLTQLLLAGVFDRAAGVVVGHLCGADDPAAADLDAVVRERLGGLDKPVLLGLPVGHRADNRAVPIGGRVILDGPSCSLVLQEPAVAMD